MKKLILIALLSTPVFWAQEANDAGVPALSIPGLGQRDALIEGILGSGDPNFTFITGTQVGRIFRDGVPSVCGVLKTCATFGGDTMNYDAYTLTNSSAVTQCITISLTVPGADWLHAIAYTTEYVPAAYCTNYIGDCGSSSSGGVTESFSVDLPAGESLVIAVTEAFVSTGLGDAYTLEITGDVSAAGVPTLSQWGLIAFIGLLIVGGLFFIRRKA